MSRKPPKQKDNRQKETFCQTQEDRNLENYLENVPSNELLASNDDRRNGTRSTQNVNNSGGPCFNSDNYEPPRRCGTAGPQYQPQGSYSSRDVCECCGCVFAPQRQQHGGRCPGAVPQCNQCAENLGYRQPPRCNPTPSQYIRRPCSAQTQRCQPQYVPKCPEPCKARSDTKQTARQKNCPRLVSAIGVKGEDRKCLTVDAQCDSRPCSTVDTGCESRPCFTDAVCESRPCFTADAVCESRPCFTADAVCDSRPCSTVDAVCDSRPCSTVDAVCDSRPCSTIDAECDSQQIVTADAQCDSRPCTATEAQCDQYAFSTVEAQCDSRPCSTMESQYETTSCTAMETQYEPCGRATVEAQCESRPCSTVEVQCDPMPCAISEAQCDSGPLATVQSRSDQKLKPSNSRSNNCSKVPSAAAIPRDPCACPSNVGSQSSLICQTIPHGSMIPIANSSAYNSYCSRVPSLQQCNAAPQSCVASAQPSLEACTTTVKVSSRKLEEAKCISKPTSVASVHGGTGKLDTCVCCCCPCTCCLAESRTEQRAPAVCSKAAIKQDSKVACEKVPSATASKAAVGKVPSATASRAAVEKVPSATASKVAVEKVPSATASKAAVEKVPSETAYKAAVEKVPSATTFKVQSREATPVSTYSKFASEEAEFSEYPKATVKEFSSQFALGSPSQEKLTTSKPLTTVPSCPNAQRRNKEITFKDVHSVQPQVDLVAIRSTSITALNERLSSQLKPGLSGLMEYMSERSISRGKKREQLKKEGRQHHDEEKDFIDFFLDCNGLKCLGILEQFQLDYEDRCKSELLHAEPTSSKIAHMLRKRLAEIAQVQASSEEKSLMDIDFAESLEIVFKVLQIDYKPKIIAIGRLHEYGIQMAEYWIAKIKQGKSVNPREICEVGTQTAAELMGQIFSLMVKSCEFLDKIGKEARRYKTKYSVDQLTQLFTVFRKLVVEEIGAIGETCGQVMVRIPGLRKSQVDEMMSDLYSQINFADVCLSRGLLAVIPMILYFDFRMKDD